MSTTKKQIVLAACLLLGSFALGSSAAADPALRIQTDLQGDFVIFGNTLVHECGGGVAGLPAGPAPAPVVGTVGDCPQGNALAPDVYWRSDAPADGQALADSSLGPDDARSTAVLALPAGAVVQYARIYWGALSTDASPDPTVRVQRADTALDTEITADAGNQVAVPADQGTGIWYQSSADVTALIAAQGPGAFRISEVASVNIVGLGEFAPTVAWYMVVFYEAPGEASRNLALFDGLDLVTSTIGSASADLSGFRVPASGFDAKLGVVAYEGEAAITGDALLFNGATLSNAENPANNFFNASRTHLGSPLSRVGDLPQTTGGPGSLSNVDFDVVDVTSLVAADDTNATIEATSTTDTFLLSAFVTSISTLKPDFVTSAKAVNDINGDGIRPGDVLEYTIEARNTGSDDAANTVVSDPLPVGVTYVVDSLSIVSGANEGAKTDAAGDDQGEYDDATRTVKVRVGAGADESAGGTLLIGESSTVRFRVTVDAGTMGVISNQAIITAAGSLGAPEQDTVTDGNGEGDGQPPTEVEVDECGVDADCADPTPFCDIAGSPRRCVECTTSAQCTDEAAPDCDFDTNVCTCVTGGNCDDADGDGLSNGAEEALGTDPNDADSDDDGVPDGSELAPREDRDGDGLIGALDPDSDNDGLFDGTELGLGCDDPATDAAAGNCRADADMGATTTNPIDPDTDNGGLRDGSEDANLNGVVDDGETDPTTGHGDDDSEPSDRDGDRLSDALEEFIGSDPDDADSDDDGLLDGEEPNPTADGDGDGLITVLDVDSDNDGLFDGTEVGNGCDHAATDTDAGHCRADNDGGMTTTSPLDPDSDGGGVTDGSEDANLNGVVDGQETDPTLGAGADDVDVADSDGDGLSDALEAFIGTDPDDVDSDDDGALDGQEPNPSDDHDGDGAINSLDADSDDDGLFDGTELGFGCADEGTDTSKNLCVADGDAGATRTSPLNADTDGGGVSDGDEDVNRDGVVDDGERDPNDPSDDGATTSADCTSDADCGGAGSGQVCSDGSCGAGCRGEGGNGCPAGQVCSSTTMDVGRCGPAQAPMGDGMEPDEGPTPGGATGVFLGGGGCECRAAGGVGQGDLSTLALIGGALLFIRRRRRRG